jgi:hypothetical protein
MSTSTILHRLGSSSLGLVAAIILLGATLFGCGGHVDNAATAQTQEAVMPLACAASKCLIGGILLQQRHGQAPQRMPVVSVGGQHHDLTNLSS